MVDNVYMSIVMGERVLALKSQSEDNAANPQAELAELRKYLRLGDRVTIKLEDMQGETVFSHSGRITLVAQPPVQITKGAT